MKIDDSVCVEVIIPEPVILKINDSVYGEIIITEPVILELIKTQELQRLKGVDQAGYPPLYKKRKKVDRLAHSIGVYWLLRMYGASIEEQIRGLIHDVSHSCFSHCIDYTLENGSETTQSLQDDVFDIFVQKSNIKEIVEKYGFDFDYIIGNDFQLEDQELPALCADRIDYLLRDALSFGMISKKDKDYILENLIVEGQNWVFKNLESAKKYADLFLKINTERYSGVSSAIMFRVVGDFLRHSLERGYIAKEDLYTTDNFVIEKISKFVDKDEMLALLWRRMNNKAGKIINDPNDYDVRISCKSRAVDPLFKDESGQTKRLSSIDWQWRETLNEESKPKPYFLKFPKNY